MGHVNAHGLATSSCDIDEAQAIGDALGPVADRIPVSAAKCCFGNLGAASGLVELIGSLLSLHEGHLFPTFNFQHPDPDCPLRIVTDQATSPGSSFLKQSVTPQGQASGVLVRR